MITFAKKSDYSLVIIGAHDGSKLGHIVHKAAAHGKVLLVEPTPYLFKRLKAKYSQNPQVELFNAAITHAKNAAKIDFFMVEDEASGLRRYGNQLGSLDPNHAQNHLEGFGNFVKRITVDATNFEELFKLYQIKSIDVLITDTEGSDVGILKDFPYQFIKPRLILFEHKHSDGTSNIGPNYASLYPINNPWVFFEGNGCRKYLASLKDSTR